MPIRILFTLLAAPTALLTLVYVVMCGVAAPDLPPQGGQRVVAVLSGCGALGLLAWAGHLAWRADAAGWALAMVPLAWLAFPGLMLLYGLLTTRHWQ